MSVSEEAPAGMVKVPLDRPARRVVAMVAQLSPLVDSAVRGRERLWCKASADKIADYLSVGRQHVQDELTAAERAGLLISEKAGRGRRRRLANPYPARFAIVSKRAISGVGCHWLDGKWAARRNAEFLFALYCELAHDERTGVRSSQEELAGRLGVDEQDVKRGLRVLRADGWITAKRTGKGNVYRVHAAALAPVPSAPVQGPEGVIHRAEPGVSTATGQGSARRQVRGQHGDTDVEPDRELDREPLARPVRAVHVGDAHASEAPPANEEIFARNGTPQARSVVAKLPPRLTAGTKHWERGRMAEAIDRVLSEGYGLGAIKAAANRTLPPMTDKATPVQVLKDVLHTLRTDTAAGYTCRDCGCDLLERYAACQYCDPGGAPRFERDPDAPMSERELAQAARVQQFLAPPPEPEPEPEPVIEPEPVRPAVVRHPTPTTLEELQRLIDEQAGAA